MYAGSTPEYLNTSFGSLLIPVSTSFAPSPLLSAPLLITAMGKFDQTIGFVLLGVVMNTYLTGVIMSQFFSYWSSSHKDPWWIRSLVAFLFIVNATQACAAVYLSWFYCVTNFANPQVVGSNLWPYPFTSLTTAVLAITNQMFQMWRIYKLTRNKIFIAFLMVSSLAACGMGAAAAIEMSLRESCASVFC
ncbi:hypothetical protein B0H13DRAFT_2428598 [Mycena leptocephala]|nr:hypothetical protein B0H13DRAFT_2428598 [Mycena leptocephala]